VIGDYYPFWWKITSGGKKANYQNPTAIVELNAATGEVYIKDTGETVLGSAGHALKLKVNHLQAEDINTENLKVVLVEEHPGCYNHLKRVIKRRWPTVPIHAAEGPITSNSSNIYLFNNTLDEALDKIDDIQLGNAIYYFDPLRSVEWGAIEKVAKKRMKNVFQTGTEFIIFLFTSDWFLGRDDFAPLPCTTRENSWNKNEKMTVSEADNFFGDQEWRKHILNEDPIQNKERTLVDLYKNRLHKWFRYVLPLPFNPKKNQLFHLILCSNYEAGINATRNFYASKTGNPRYLPGKSSQEQAFMRFSKIHPETLKGSDGRKKPISWRILWRIIKYHEEGICDCFCRDFEEIVPEPNVIQETLKWLLNKHYLEYFGIKGAWNFQIERFQLNWKIVRDRLNIEPPPELKPISPEKLGESTLIQDA
jgi:three-Cys-motif partner protein